VYEIDSLGTRYFINRIDFIARNWHPGSEGVVSAEGIPHAHRFTRGNRIRVELTNIDKTDRIVLGSYPFVAPVFANTSATIYADRSHASYIELPLIGNPASVASGPAVLPLAYRVGQNYPNPFNPSTTIRFSLPRESDVTLTVFDAIGRKVATLFDGRGAPGDHDVSWNAGGSQGSEGVHRGAASAVYFYRMTAKPAGSADPPSEITGKMVLLR
jgi:hypothetical protein